MGALFLLAPVLRIDRISKVVEVALLGKKSEASEKILNLMMR